MPLPVDLRTHSVSEYGWHRLEVSVDSGEPIVLHVKVAKQPASTAQAVSRAQRRHN